MPTRAKQSIAFLLTVVYLCCSLHLQVAAAPAWYASADGSQQQWRGKPQGGVQADAGAAAHIQLPTLFSGHSSHPWPVSWLWQLPETLLLPGSSVDLRSTGVYPALAVYRQQWRFRLLFPHHFFW